MKAHIWSMASTIQRSQDGDNIVERGQRGFGKMSKCTVVNRCRQENGKQGERYNEQEGICKSREEVDESRVSTYICRSGILPLVGLKYTYLLQVTLIRAT